MGKRVSDKNKDNKRKISISKIIRRSEKKSSVSSPSLGLGLQIYGVYQVVLDISQYPSFRPPARLNFFSSLRLLRFHSTPLAVNPVFSANSLVVIRWFSLINLIIFSLVFSPVFSLVSGIVDFLLNVTTNCRPTSSKLVSGSLDKIKPMPLPHFSIKWT